MLDQLWFSSTITNTVLMELLAVMGVAVAVGAAVDVGVAVDVDVGVAVGTEFDDVTVKLACARVAPETTAATV
jgi:hypothetical protein